MRGSPATRSRASGDAEHGLDGVGKALVGPDHAERENGATVVRRSGSLCVAGCGMTRSLASGTPNEESVRLPRSLCVTIRSKRPKRRLHVRV